MLQGGDPTVKLTPFWSGVAGIGAGVTVSFIAAPIEHVKARLQVQYDAKTKLYAGPIDCARQLVKDKLTCVIQVRKRVPTANTLLFVISNIDPE